MEHADREAEIQNGEGGDGERSLRRGKRRGIAEECVDQRARSFERRGHAQIRGAHASRVLVAASRRDELPDAWLVKSV